MLRLVTVCLIGALLVAPLGFGATSSTLVANIARLFFVALMLVFILLVALGVFWGRRWVIERGAWNLDHNALGTRT